LADDLQRFLKREPIKARPVRFFERAAKWARRKPWQAAAAGLGLMLGVGLTVGLVWVAEKNREVRHANDQLSSANASLEETNKRLTLAKEETGLTLAVTLSGLDRYFFEFSDALKDIPNGQKLRLGVLDQARRTLDKLGQLRPGDVTIRNYQMTGYDRLGN